MRRAPGFALLTLAGLALGAGRCYDRNQYEPPALIEETLSISTEGGVVSIPADGVSRLRVIARITPRADLDKRTVVFSTSAGTLVGGNPGANASEREVVADSSGLAAIELQSGLQVGTAALQARIKEVPGLARTLAVSFTSADVDGVIRFVASPGSAPADGASRSTFTVQVSSSLPLGTEVRFQTSGGQFVPENSSTATR